MWGGGRICVLALTLYLRVNKTEIEGWFGEVWDCKERRVIREGKDSSLTKKGQILNRKIV